MSDKYSDASAKLMDRLASAYKELFACMDDTVTLMALAEPGEEYRFGVGNDVLKRLDEATYDLKRAAGILEGVTMGVYKNQYYDVFIRRVWLLIEAKDDDRV